MGKLLETSEEAKAAYRMMKDASRGKRPAIVVEGTGDEFVLSKFRDRRGNLDIIPIQSNLEKNKKTKGKIPMNKEIVLDVVSEHAKQHPQLVRGLVDVDYDYISEILLNTQSSKSRYGGNIVDTSPHTDMDLIVLEKIGVERGIRHVRDISPEERSKRESLALEMAQWMGSIRIMKAIWEKEKSGKTLYLKLKDLRVCCESKPPNNVDEMIDYLVSHPENRSKLPLSAKEMKSKVRIIIEKIKSLEIPWYHYVNGHDLTSCLGGLFQENDFRYSYFKKMARKKIKYSHVESHPLFQAIEHWRQSQGFPTFFIGS